MKLGKDIGKKITAFAAAASMLCSMSAMSAINAFAADTGDVKKDSETSLSIDDTGVVLELNSTYTLPQIVSSFSGIIYNVSSSNSNIIKVQNGKIYAVGTGTADLIMTLPSGRKISVSVTVKKPDITLSLSKTAMTLGVGESSFVSAITKNVKGNLKYTSSNSTVVSVDQKGRITAKKNGTAKITVSNADNTKSVSCNITVKPAPSGIEFEEPVITLGVGEKFKLDYVIPNNTVSSSVTFNSSNAQVALVNSSTGFVTARKTGTAVVTVKTHNGKTSNCKVVVKYSPSGVKLDQSNITAAVGEKFTVGASVNNGAASGQLSFTSSNSSIVAKADSSTGEAEATFIAKKPGNAAITVKTYNDKTSTANVKVVNAPTDIKFSKSEVKGKVGQIVTLSTIVSGGYPGVDKTIYSTKSTVAKVISTGTNSCVVKLQSEGTAYITVKTYNGKIARCKITVTR